MEVGGAEVQMSVLARNLGPNFEVRVFTLYARGPLAQEFQDAGISVASADKRGRWDLIGPYRRLVRLLKQFRPEIIHSFLAPPNVFAALAKPSQPGCHLVWGFRASNMDFDRYDWSHRTAEWLQRRLVHRVDRIVTNSQAGRAFSESLGFPEDRQMVIRNGIDTEKFSPNPASGKKLREDWSIASDVHLVGLAARLDPMKDHGTFLQAAALAARTNPSMHFVCVGEGAADYRAGLQTQASQLGLNDRLTWAGHHHDMNAVYNALDVSTLTSAFGEGFPNAVGEAMACGKPCVVTDVGDAADVVGETGFHVPAGDHEALAKKWAELANENSDGRESRSTACRTRVVEKFTVEAMSEAHRILYAQLASEKPGN